MTIDEKHRRASEPTTNVWHLRRQTLAEYCRRIATKPFPARWSVDLRIAQDCASEILRTEVRGLSNNKIMVLLESSERVVSLLDDHSTPGFASAAWEFSQRVATALERHPCRWKTEPWCLPDTVVVGNSPIVVLDTKDWIYLSKPENSHQFEALRSHASNGIRFPISETALEELLSGGTPAQRQVILPVIEALGLSFILDSNVVWHHEIECALDSHVGPDRRSAGPLGSVPFVTDLYGSFGRTSPKLRIQRAGRDVTEAFIREHPEKVAAVKEAENELPTRLAKSVLGEGEKTGMWSSLIDRDLIPYYDKTLETYQGMPQLVRERFLRRLASAVLLISMKDSRALAIACVARGKSLEDVLREGLDSYGNNILNVMPSFDSLVILTMAFIQRGQKIVRNDLQDARHLAATVPYADFVMTDKDMKNRFALSTLASKARADVLSDMDDLLEKLDCS